MQKVRPSVAPTTSRPKSIPTRIGTKIAPDPAEFSPQEFGPEFVNSSDLRRIMAGPQTLDPGVIRRLQQTIGNKSVQRLLQGRKPVTPARPASPPNVIQRFRE